MKLPTPDWLTLMEAEHYVSEFVDANGEEIRASLARTFRDAIVRSRGRSKTYFKHETKTLLRGTPWDGAEIDWDGSYFSNGEYIFEDVEVERSSIDKWLKRAQRAAGQKWKISVPLNTSDSDIDEVKIRVEALDKWRSARQSTREQYWRWYIDAKKLPVYGNKGEVVAALIDQYEREPGISAPAVKTVRRELDRYFLNWEK